MQQGNKKKYKKKGDESEADRQKSIFSSAKTQKRGPKDISVLVEDFQSMELEQKMAVDFNYTFNEYFRLVLVKILPLHNPQLTIDTDKKLIKGWRKDIEAIIGRIKQELDIFCVKLVKIKCEMDVQDLEYNLGHRSDAKIYKQKFMKRTAEDVIKHYNFKQQGEAFIDKIQNTEETTILVRIQKINEKRCMEIIQDCIQKLKETATPRGKLQEKGKDSQSDVHNKSSSLQEEECHQQSYYQVIDKEKLSKGSDKSRSTNILRNSKLSEPYDDDSISAVGEKNRNKKNKKSHKEERQIEQPQMFKKEEPKPPKVPKVEQKEVELPKVVFKEISRYEYEAHNINMNEFQQWLKKSKFSQDQVRIQSEKDPYNDDEVISYTIKLMATEQTQEQIDKKIEYLEIYLKYRKVILVNLKNTKYKEELFQNYEREDENILIKVVKGYKSTKWNEKTMWRCISNNQYTSQKKAGTNIYFEAFYLEGLKCSVEKYSEELTDKLSKQPLDDVPESISVRFDAFGAYLQQDRVQNMIRTYTESCIKDMFKEICKIKSIEFNNTGIKINFQVKIDQQPAFQKHVKSQIIKKLSDDIKMQTYDAKTKIDRATYAKLQKSVILCDKKETSFTYVSSVGRLNEVYTNISSIFNEINKTEHIVRTVDDYLAGKHIEEYLRQLNKEEEFKQIKITCAEEKYSKYKFTLFGKATILHKIQQKMDEKLAEILSTRANFVQLIRQKEMQIFKDNKFFNETLQKHGILLNMATQQIDAKLVIQKDIDNFKNKTIFIKKSKNLEMVPHQSVIVFRTQNELELFSDRILSTFKNYLKKHHHPNLTTFSDTVRGYGLIIKGSNEPVLLLKEAFDFRQTNNNIVMILPEKEKQSFVRKLATHLSEEKAYLDREFNILLIEFGQSTIIQDQLKIQPYAKGKDKKKIIKEKISKIYFIEDHGQKFYYGKSGNDKIEQALRNGQDIVILNNDDLHISHVSHTFDRSKMIMIHNQSAKPFPVQVRQNIVEFILNNTVYEMPPAQSTIVLNCIKTGSPQADLSIGLYKITLTTMKQVNIFSGFERSLKYETNIVKGNFYDQQIRAFYKVPMGRIQYQFAESDDENAVRNIAREVVAQIESKYQHKSFDLKNVQQFCKDDEQLLRDGLEDYAMEELSFDRTNKTAKLRTIEDRDFSKAELLIKIMISAKEKKEVKYPATWQPQNNEIETFFVDPLSAEYLKVKQKFTIAPIKELIRIQNKIIYKKYAEEGSFIMSLNNGTPVKTMQLFHGTKTTNPQQIYKDKEESFNINYSSDHNLLGKGIYFAERSQYSHNYRHTENKLPLLGALGVGTNSMFLCEVYVGQSQKCLKHDNNIKDTSYRDPANKIRFQSMTDFLNGSNIYVVYKSRRAYPMYLIKY